MRKGWFPQSPLEGRGPSGRKHRRQEFCRQEFCRRCTACQVQKGMASGEDVFDSNRIINTLCIQAEQKLFAIPAEICFHRSLVPLHLITPAKRTSLSKSSSLGDSTQFPAGQAGGTGGVSFSHLLVPTVSSRWQRVPLRPDHLPQSCHPPDIWSLAWPACSRHSPVFRKMLGREIPGSQGTQAGLPPPGPDSVSTQMQSEAPGSLLTHRAGMGTSALQDH